MATLIVKATERCNSNCYYCDVVNKRDTGRTMTTEVLDLLFARAGEYLAAHPGENLELLWHGGEPLLVGPQFYRDAIDLQRRYCADFGDRIEHSIQTNLTCFDEDFLPVFADMGITAVGTSYDPEPGMRGPGTDIDLDLYNRRFMSAVRILDRQGIGWGLIFVVTKRSLARPRDVFYFLTNLKLSGGVNFNPVLIYDEQRKGVAVTPEEFADFLGEIFPIWWEHRDRYPHVEPFKSLVDNIIDGNTSLACVDSGRCTYHHINISPTGETSQCGRSADWGLLPYGNLRDHSLAGILVDRQRDALEERQGFLRDNDCLDCRFWELCHGGCPLDAYAASGTFMAKSDWCEVKRRFITNYFEPVTGVTWEPRGLVV